MYQYKVISGGTTIGFESPAEAWSYIIRTKVFPVEYHDGECARMVFRAEADSLPLEECGLSVRAYNILMRNGCRTFGDVHEAAQCGDFPKMRNLGKKSMTEIYGILGKLYPLDNYLNFPRWKARDCGEPEPKLELDPDDEPYTISDLDLYDLEEDY